MASVPAVMSDDDGSAAAAARVEEEALVAAARAGNEAAFDLLTSQYYPSVLRYLRRQVEDADQAKDLTQQTFLDAYRQIRRLSRDAAFPTWLFTIATNALRMERRRFQVRRMISLDWLSERPGGVPPALRQGDPSEACDNRVSVQRVLRQLSPALREALVLHDMDDFRTSEVAQILGINPRTAEQRITRARIEFERRYLALERGPQS